MRFFGGRWSECFSNRTFKQREGWIFWSQKEEKIFLSDNGTFVCLFVCLFFFFFFFFFETNKQTDNCFVWRVLCFVRRKF